MRFFFFSETPKTLSPPPLKKKKVVKNIISMKRKREGGSCVPPTAKKATKQVPCPVGQQDIVVTPVADAIPVAQVAEWKAKLARDGFVVLTGVCDAATVDRMIGHWHTDLQSLGTGITDAARASLFQKANLPGIASVGIFKDPACGFGQSRTAWEARRLAKPVFEKLWGTQELQTSFDTGSLFPNWAFPELAASRTRETWLHIDKGPMFADVPCVQGLFTWLPAGAATGGLVVCPGTHKLANRVLAAYSGHRSSNYVPLDFGQPEVRKIVRDAGVHLVSAPAGALVLWDSALIHANNPALVRPNQQAGPVLRFANYVCMLPARTDPATVEFRQRAVDDGLSCNHWTFVQTNNKSHSKAAAPRGPILANRLAYPRHKSFKPLVSVALPNSIIRSEFGDLL